MKDTTKNLIKRCIFIVFFIVLLTVVFSIVVRYIEVGEESIPYEIEKILIVSQVSTSSNDDTENIWNISLEEFNDIYITLTKNNEEDERTIKSVSIENFTVTALPKVGSIAIYRPTGDIGDLYSLSEKNYIDDAIVYTGASVDTMKNLEIRNEGGTIGFRVNLEELGNYISNDYNEEITYDGELLTKSGITIDDITFKMKFDILITLDNDITFTGTVNLDLPNEDILVNNDSNVELTDFSDVVFKRE